MISKWIHLKEQSVVMRRSGMSITTIEQKLGIPKSTLSGWFKNIELTDTQRAQLKHSKAVALEKARLKASEAHRANKAMRLNEAKQQAIKTLNEIELDGPTLDLALAMLYLGEGAKNGTTSIASSDPKILLFTLSVLESNYNKDRETISCELHLRADQNAEDMKKYWSKKLRIPITKFKYVYFDQRTKGAPTYNHYKGVCVLQCGGVAIQRKLIYLYNLFCDRVAELK